MVNEMYQMSVMYSKWSQNISIFSITSHSKNYPNWDFGFEIYTIWQPCCTHMTNAVNVIKKVIQKERLI
jgi:hypothetical protein